ncbi:hypothetical protein COCOBI_02-8350 [Coccomyxa sp. Obi]|nr:hypothetical protein COCOBI_02-8350 [Coccomyxa sp. Obi]
MVSQRFNRLLSWPDPSQRLQGSVTVNVDRDRKGSLPPSLIDRYLLQRAAGFDRVCFQSWSARQEGQQDWETRRQDWTTMHNFFAGSLPQLAAVFALYHVQMEIAVLGGGLIFFPNSQSYEEE